MFSSVLSVAICTTLVGTNTVIRTPTNSKNLLSTIITSLDDYFCIVKHFETSTKTVAIFNQDDSMKSVELFNYDLMDEPRYRGSSASKKKINIFAFSSEKYYQLFEEEIYGINLSDSAIIIHGFAGEIPTYMLNNLYYIRMVYLFDIRSNSLSYCEYKIANRCELRDISRSGDISQALKYVPKNNVTLKNMTFKIGYRQHFTNFEYSIENGKIKISGLEAYILKTLSEKLQFNYELIAYPANATEGKTETMIKHIQSEEIDWAIGGILRNFERTFIYDFSKYFKIEGYTLLFAKRRKNYSFAFFQETKNSIKYEVAVSGCCCILTLFMYLSTVIIRRKETDLPKNVLVVLAPLYEQSFKIKFKTKSAKGLISLWWFCAIVMCNYYKVTALLNLLVKGTSYTTTEELLKAGYTFVISDEDFMYIRRYCHKTEFSTCSRILNRTETTTDICVHLQRMFDEPLAIIGGKTLLENWVLNLCKGVLSQKAMNELTYTNDNIMGLAWNSWPFRKMTFLPKLFSKYFSKFEAGGFLINQVKNIYRNKNMQQIQDANALRLNNVANSFKILFLGYSFGIFVFIIEILIKRKHTEKCNGKVFSKQSNLKLRSL